MKRESIEKKVRDVLKSQLGLKDEQVKDENKKIIGDLGADSLDQIEILMAMEEEFEIDVSDSEAEKITTIKEAVDFADKALN